MTRRICGNLQCLGGGIPVSQAPFILDLWPLRWFIRSEVDHHNWAPSSTRFFAGCSCHFLEKDSGYIISPQYTIKQKKYNQPKHWMAHLSRNPLRWFIATFFLQVSIARALYQTRYRVAERRSNPVTRGASFKTTAGKSLQLCVCNESWDSSVANPHSFNWNHCLEASYQPSVVLQPIRNYHFGAIIPIQSMGFIYLPPFPCLGFFSWAVLSDEQMR